ncbi:uncharacterized protein LOC106094041 [Stomoxys calcitrans]|uniref:DUF4794 domain-containing protein n=1 Tax=Stomoxys calcitrans TaxID=35570 RepID=A0A1I8P7L4_STOCA|nr:uncharacterized protein LOC106094041 [Stomoxys calcitrans]
MKFLLIGFAFIGIAAAVLPDSATQGPNPQDIATPEPEYIDIDLPEPPRPAPPAPVHRFAAPVQRAFVPAPAPIQQRQAFAAPRVISHPAPRPVPQPIIHHQQHAAPSNVFQQRAAAPAQGHAFNVQSGYQYRRPVYVRRVYYHRRA